MASSVTLVLLLALCVSHILTATISRSVSHLASLEELQSSLFVNQLAILDFLNGGGKSSSGNSGRRVMGMESQHSDATSLENNVIKLREEYISLREDVAELQGTNNSSQEMMTNLLMAQQALEERVAVLEETQAAVTEDEARIQLQDTTFSETVTELVTETVTSPESCDEEGAAFVNDDCSITVCHQGYLEPYQGPLAPNVTISQLEEKNCIVLVTEALGWQDARDNCRDMGGDLLVPRDLKGLKPFLEHHCCGPWFGMKNLKWLDGRPTLEGEWDTVETMNVARLSDCGWVLEDKAKIHPAPCDYNFHSICHIGVQYP